MNDLRFDLGQIVSSAFASLNLPPALGRVNAADRPDLADFQCNGAMAAAKQASRNPREIATEIIGQLTGHALIELAETAGPGFINLRVAPQALTDRANALAQDPRTGVQLAQQPRKILVDYGGPNVAKPMHVGHLRASIIGESIKRLFRLRGDEVLGDAHFGDWGFQMGLLIVAVGDDHPDLATALDQNTDAAEQMLADTVDLPLLDRLYPLAAARAKSDPDYRDRARRATAELQSGHPPYRRLWKQFVTVSRIALEREFSALGIHFDLWKGESDVHDLIDPMVESLAARGLIESDQGARIIRVARETDKRELPPLLVVSSEGSAMYGTTDLATILDRRQSFDPDLILYCVDQRQSDHFAQVFRAAELAGYTTADGVEHIGFGTMNGTDGKPFKTREGGVLKLHDLIEMTRAKARERLKEAGLGNELSPEAFEDTAHKVAVAALKFADLSNFRGTSYVFDLDRFTSFEGKTGPYLLYQAVRIKSVLRRAENEGQPAGPIMIAEAAERELLLLLDGFNHTLEESCERRAPNLVADHAYRLAQTFSRFYAACPILIATDPAQRASRLSLAGLVLRQLEISLDLLGIETPERM